MIDEKSELLIREPDSELIVRMNIAHSIAAPGFQPESCVVAVERIVMAFEHRCVSPGRDMENAILRAHFSCFHSGPKPVSIESKGVQRGTNFLNKGCTFRSPASKTSKSPREQLGAPVPRERRSANGTEASHGRHDQRFG